MQFDKLEKNRAIRMVQKYFLESWLLPCSLRSHRIANPTPKNGLRHFSALPTHHPNKRVAYCKRKEQEQVKSCRKKCIFVEA